MDQAAKPGAVIVSVCGVFAAEGGTASVKSPFLSVADVMSAGNNVTDASSTAGVSAIGSASGATPLVTLPVMAKSPTGTTVGAERLGSRPATHFWRLTGCVTARGPGW